MGNRIEKTIMKPTYIEHIEVGEDNTRLGISTSIKPKSFGEIEIKFQEAGQKHKNTSW